jgi:hypothetical protein
MKNETGTQFHDHHNPGKWYHSIIHSPNEYHVTTDLLDMVTDPLTKTVGPSFLTITLFIFKLLASFNFYAILDNSSY